MAKTVADIMTRDPMTIEGDEPVIEAARRMRGADTGDVVVLTEGRPDGILTDRDIAVRVVAEGLDPAGTRAHDVCSGDLTSVAPDTTLEQASRFMRGNAVRRLPVVEQGRLVGVLSIGDLAIEQDDDSTLAQISAAAGNS